MNFPIQKERQSGPECWQRGRDKMIDRTMGQDMNRQTSSGARSVLMYSLKRLCHERSSLALNLDMEKTARYPEETFTTHCSDRLSDEKSGSGIAKCERNEKYVRKRKRSLKKGSFITLAADNRTRLLVGPCKQGKSF
jgi:hypothetical protein